MTLPTRIILALLGVLVLVWLSNASVRRVYIEPHAKLTVDIKTVFDRVDRYRQGMNASIDIQEALQAFVDRTLGGDLESVDHRLRSRLNRLAERFQLEETTVGTGRAVSRQSPAKRKFSRREKELRDEIDFIELNGWVSATGTLEQVIRLVDAVEAEPWIKRIDQLRIDPSDNGERFTVNVRLTTLFLPGREPRGGESLTGSPSRYEKYASLVNANPFRLSDRAPQSVAIATVAPTPQVDVLASWTVTGIVENADGMEVWIRNASTNETRLLLVGDTFENISLVSARGDEAIFSDGERRFILQVGHFLSDRSRVNQ